MKYKKILLAILLIPLVIIGLIKVLNISEKITADNDKKYTEEFLNKHINTGINTVELKEIFKKFNKKLGLWACADEAETEEDCKAEKALVVSLPLPSNNIWLGKGDAQVYFYLDKKGILEGYDFELYYPRHH